MQAEFEEKEFENYFNRHLNVIQGNFWSPGQSLEGKIGFDGAAMVDHFLFPHLLMTHTHRLWDLQQGVSLNAGHMSQIFSVLDSCMPPYRFNFFAQYKRPEYLSQSNSNEWGSWNNPYYRYEIKRKQNNLLCKIENISGAAAVVSYCCPVYYTKEKLWDANTSGTILQQTNFVRPSRLVKHHIYSFTSPGGRGKGHSEEEEIVGETLEEMLALGKETNAPRPVSVLVKLAGKVIRDAFAELGGEADFARKISAQLVGDANTSDEGFALVDAVAHITSLRFAFGTAVMLMGGEDKR